MYKRIQSLEIILRGTVHGISGHVENQYVYCGHCNVYWVIGKDYLRKCKKECFDRVHLAYITWQEILISLDKISTNTVFEDRVVNDIRDYLKEKGFSSFSGFHTTDLLIDRGLYYEFG